eukprot:CAMPEP_0171509704 /NCGR_PEP_ID=MMETSP0958-20121227/14924_1 /TAXON_ID=87120 /ORGANISM="Aurantiochytrium limacinum, Strain ATCCMYA-1381" /LENGTH=239 /DNA_ID=CAMNT_0012046985 /DNA_START=258 /DNA_END=979 /DNA_ORIENTATION=-
MADMAHEALGTLAETAFVDVYASDDPMHEPNTIVSRPAWASWAPFGAAGSQNVPREGLTDLREPQDGREDIHVSDPATRSFDSTPRVLPRAGSSSLDLAGVVVNSCVEVGVVAPGLECCMLPESPRRFLERCVGRSLHVARELEPLHVSRELEPLHVSREAPGLRSSFPQHAPESVYISIRRLFRYPRIRNFLVGRPRDRARLRIAPRIFWETTSQSKASDRAGAKDAQIPLLVQDLCP